MLIIYLGSNSFLKPARRLKQMPTRKNLHSVQASERQRSHKSLIMFAIRCVIVCLLVSLHVFFRRAAGGRLGNQKQTQPQSALTLRAANAAPIEEWALRHMYSIHAWLNIQCVIMLRQLTREDDK